MPVLIVESPAKCKTISKYVSNDFQILPSYGHVRSLPSKKNSVLPDENFKMVYEAHEDSKKHITVLTKAIKNTDTVYLATDPDREGEAISWHIVEMMRSKRAIKKSTIIHRITFNEITKPAVLHAIANPREIDMDLVQAQQARQALDYLFGFTLSPLLWKKLPGSRSAGRVQSVALKIICERENEIKRFISEEYWKITSTLNTPQLLEASLISVEGKRLEKLSIKSENQANVIASNLTGKQYKIIKVEKKEVKRRPSPPFITSTLQQDAANKLGYTTKRTMMIAQKLYEGIKIGEEEIGLITYMRTDGLYINADFIENTRKMIKSNFGPQYLPKSLNKYKSKAKNSQEAHEAIRPTNINLTPAQAAVSLTEEQSKLYKLIWDRMVASQMEVAILSQSSIDFESLDKYALLRSTGSIIKFDGFYKIYRNTTDDSSSKILPNLNVDEMYKIKTILPTQHFTQPSPRFTEATLVKMMEELGIGRPSTYATIIAVLQDRKYVTLESKKFIPENRGQFVTAFLNSFFSRYVEYNFTSDLEESLDKVSNNELEWLQVLQSFWDLFILNVKDVEKHNISDVLAKIDHLLDIYIFPQNANGDIDRNCPKCKTYKLNLNIGKFGAFTGCSNYPECDFRKSILNDNNIEITEPESLGKHPVSQEEIMIKTGPYGIYLQCEKTRSTIPKGFDAKTITIDQAVKLLSMPYSIGIDSSNNAVIKIGIGKYGPYILHDDKQYTSIDVNQMFNITLDEALLLIKKKNKKQTLSTYNDKEIYICNGRYGLYIKYDGKNIAIPKDLRNEGDLTPEKAIELIQNKNAK